MGDYDWRPYVPAARRRRNAEREMQKLRKKGHPVSPVAIEGRAIARTFWGKAWCDNLERYSDYANRLPRGRTYVRNGSVIDLQIAPGEVGALVSGSEIYRVALQVSPVGRTRWAAICTDCAGAVDSLVELLQGRFSQGVMERICQQRTGLFPAPSEMSFSCTCPDWASMCKHVAAVLYGIGARLDGEPELLFRLRKVDEKDLVARAGAGLPLSRKAPAEERILAAGGLSELFGLDIGTSPAEPARGPARAPRRTGGPRRAARPRPEPAALDASPKIAGRRTSTGPKKRTPGAKAGPKARPRERKATKR